MASRAIWLGNLILFVLWSVAQSAQPKVAGRAVAKPGEIVIGIEYAMYGPAKSFAEMGVPAAKFYPDIAKSGSIDL